MNRPLLQFTMLIGLFLAQEHLTYAQNNPFSCKARNAIYLELLGANQAYSLNYDRLVGSTTTGSWFFGYRVGGSLLGKHLVESRAVGELYALLGKQKSHLELGISSSLGRNWQYDQSPYGGSANVLVAPVIGYRFQEPGGISFFRFTLSPSFTINGQANTNGHGLLFGIGFGRSF